MACVPQAGESRLRAFWPIRRKLQTPGDLRPVSLTALADAAPSTPATASDLAHRSHDPQFRLIGKATAKTVSETLRRRIEAGPPPVWLLLRVQTVGLFPAVVHSDLFFNEIGSFVRLKKSFLAGLSAHCPARQGPLLFPLKANPWPAP